MDKISAVITVFNEEGQLEGCLESIKNFAQEIIVVDTGSTDKSISIAKKFTSKVFKHENPGFVEPVRNFGISKASENWVFIIDADERLSVSLAGKLKEIVKENAADVVKIPRKNIIFGKWMQHTGWWPDFQVRFFKKGYVKWSNKLHCDPQAHGKIMELPVLEEYGLVHENYQKISRFLVKSERYSKIKAKEFIESGQEFKSISLLLDPFHEFLSRFFAREGFKDGLHGFVMSSLMAIEEFMTKIRIWENKGYPEDPSFNQNLKTETKKMVDELMFWVKKQKSNKNLIRNMLFSIFR